MVLGAAAAPTETELVPRAVISATTIAVLLPVIVEHRTTTVEKAARMDLVEQLLQIITTVGLIGDKLCSVDNLAMEAPKENAKKAKLATPMWILAQ